MDSHLRDRPRLKGNVIDFPVIDDVPSLLWVINLGCIDLNQWYARCDDIDRPDYVHFDLDPGDGATFAQVRECALIVRDALETLGMKPLVKTSGSKGLHVYVPDRARARAEGGVDVRQGARRGARLAASGLMTSEYRVAKRPKGRVLVDYNQNALGPHAGEHLFRAAAAAGDGLDAADLGGSGGRRHASRTSGSTTCATRIAKVGDLWKPLLAARGRTDLDAL